MQRLFLKVLIRRVIRVIITNIIAYLQYMDMWVLKLEYWLFTLRIDLGTVHYTLNGPLALISAYDSNSS